MGINVIFVQNGATKILPCDHFCHLECVREDWTKKLRHIEEN